MATNLYFSDKVVSEQRLYEDIVIESLKMYGQDVYYLPRTIVDKDEIFNEDIPSQFSNAYKVEMYIENVDGFDGEGDLFTKFGVEIRDEATFIVSRKRFGNTAAQYDNEIDGERPREGDLIYLPMSKSLFEISHVEDEQPFYQIANLPTYKCRAQLFEYSGEDLDTGVIDIDNIEVDNTYQYVLYYTKPVTATATSVIDSNGTVTSISLADSGDGYRETFPDLSFASPPGGVVTAASIVTTGLGYIGAQNVATTGGTGTGFTVNTTGAGGIVSFSINQGGTGYVVGDVVTIAGGGGNATIEIDTITNNTTATGTARVVSGQVSILSITNAGTGYTTAPAVSIEAPQAVSFDRGETIQQTFASGVKMSAEVVMQKDSDAALYVTHVGADDGKFHTFIADRDIIGQTTNAISTLKSTSELNNMANTEDNTDFDVEGASFIDFSENNPFGDPE